MGHAGARRSRARRNDWTLGCVMAHPDDETFGVGGTLIRYVDEGIATHSLCLTEGEQGALGETGRPIVTRERLGPTRAGELREAGRRMGLASVTVLRWPDGGLAEAPADAVTAEIVSWLRRVRPDVVITWGPDGGYGHPDHIAAGLRAQAGIEIAATEARPDLGRPHRVHRCYGYVIAAEALDGLGDIYPGFIDYMKTLAVKPQRWTRDRLGAVIDQGPYLERKLHAMEAHQTQASDLRVWRAALQRGSALFREDVFIRVFPDPGGELEHDLFAGLRAPA